MPRETPVPELKVLRRKDASVVDENDWAQFDLSEVEVRGTDGSLTSLFLADPDHPVTITGQLTTKGSEPQVKAAILPAYKSKPRIPVLVHNVTYFAFGIFDTGGYAIWASGEAGWHTIQPAKSYEKIYQHMIEGLSLLYRLVDAYENGKKTPAEDLFKAYAKENKITVVAAAERFYSHGAFLASRMSKGEEGIKWGHTSFYQHLRKTHPEAFAPRAKPPATAAQPTATSAPAKATATSSKSSTSVTRTVATRTQARETSSRSQSAEGRPTRAAATAATAVPTTTKKITRASESVQPQQNANSIVKTRTQSKQSQTRIPLLSEVNKAKARDVWKFIQKKANETLPEIGEMTVETFARFLFQEYEFQDEREAQYFLQYLAPDLVGMMSILRNRSYDPWTELPIYDELMEAKIPSRIKVKVATLTMQKREKPLPGQEEEDTAGSDEDSSEESVMDKEEATNRKREAARRRISALRPKSASKYSGKAAKRKGKERATTEDEDEEMLDADTPDDAMSVDTPSKRKSMSDNEDDEEEPEYPNKRFTRSQGNLDPELEDLEFEIQQAKSIGLPIRRKASQSSVPTTSKNGQSSVRVGLVSEPAPSTVANAPGDVWMCPHAGCVHKVYGASEDASKELIREHVLDHSEKERVDLIKNEENMTRLPVNHLLKRLREIAERTGGEQLRALDGGGLVGLFPPPLERKVY